MFSNAVPSKGRLVIITHLKEDEKNTVQLRETISLRESKNNDHTFLKITYSVPYTHTPNFPTNTELK